MIIKSLRALFKFLLKQCLEETDATEEIKRRLSFHY